MSQPIETRGPKLTLTYPIEPPARPSDVTAIRLDDGLRPYDPASSAPSVTFVNRETGETRRFTYDPVSRITGGTVTLYGVKS